MDNNDDELNQDQEEDRDDQDDQGGQSGQDDRSSKENRSRNNRGDKQKGKKNQKGDKGQGEHGQTNKARHPGQGLKKKFNPKEQFKKKFDPRENLKKLGKEQFKKALKQAAKQAVKQGVKKAALNPYVIAIIIILLLILLLLALILGGSGDKKEGGVTLTKSGPPEVANGAEIKYSLQAAMTAGGGEATDTGGTAAACGQKSNAPEGSGCDGSGSWAKKPSPDGYYHTTNFGCNKGFPKDGQDNCIPGCLAKLDECKGMGGRACEEKIEWYSANMGQYGCGSRLKVTKPSTGKAIIVLVMDAGPGAICQGKRYRFDMSQKAAKELGGDGIVKVEKVDKSTKLGPVTSCAGGQTRTTTTVNEQFAMRQDTPHVAGAKTVQGVLAAHTAASASGSTGAGGAVELIVRPKVKDTYVINKAVATGDGTGITIVDTIPENAIFVSCTGGCTTDPPNASAGAVKSATWKVAGGGGGDSGSSTGGSAPGVSQEKWDKLMSKSKQYGAGWIAFLNDAKAVAAEEDYPVAVIIGQAALETGHGTSNIAKTKKNFFGYKAFDNNTSAASTYSTPKESIKDYVKLIKGGNGGNTPKYKEAYANRSNPQKMVELIKAAGYASDPNYVKSVTSLWEFQLLTGK